MELSAEDKLKRARIQIQKTNPFFAYLSLYLKFREDKNGEVPPWAGLGVNVEGELCYKKEFVEKLTEEELMGVLIHEILHLSLLHLTRRGTREPVVWNIAADAAVNSIVKENRYSLPSGGVIPDYNNCVEVFGKTITEVNKKTVEKIYEELEQFAKKLQQGNGNGKGKGDGEECDGDGQDNKEGNGNGNGNYSKSGYKPFDHHKEGKRATEEDKKQQEEYWKGKANEALVAAKLRGNLPKGMERLVSGLSEAKVNWRDILQRYVQRAIPYDYTYSNPSKKSVSSGYYMPNTIKDHVDVCVAIDTSGSIGQDELKEFISEIIGMAKAFNTRINMRLLTHDVTVHDDLLIANGNIEKIKQLKLHGGGGTSHKDLFNYIDKNHRNAKLVICFTDGDSDLDDIDLHKHMFEKVFVISENGHDDQLKGFKGIIKLADYKYG